MQTLERTEDRSSEDLGGSPEAGKKVGELESPEWEILRPEEYGALKAQCAIVAMIACIVVGLIAA